MDPDLAHARDQLEAAASIARKVLKDIGVDAEQPCEPRPEGE